MGSLRSTMQKALYNAVSIYTNEKKLFEIRLLQLLFEVVLVIRK